MGTDTDRPELAVFKGRSVRVLWDTFVPAGEELYLVDTVQVVFVDSETQTTAVVSKLHFTN